MLGKRELNGRIIVKTILRNQGIKYSLDLTGCRYVALRTVVNTAIILQVSFE
jgi:hypothetical protein